MKISHRSRAARVLVTCAVAGALLTGAAAGAPVAGSPTGAPAAPPAATAPHPADADEIRALFDDWNAALATGDPEAVADRYAADAVLEPTLSNVIRDDRAGIVDYFEHFLLQRPAGEIDESHVEPLGPYAAVDSGAYTFTLTDPATGVVTEVPARYTFVYERDRQTGEWLIVNHHSSAMPES